MNNRIITKKLKTFTFLYNLMYITYYKVLLVRIILDNRFNIIGRYYTFIYKGTSIRVYIYTLMFDISPAEHHIKLLWKCMIMIPKNNNTRMFSPLDERRIT